MTPLRVAVVGLGWVGVHRHLPFLKRCPAVEVVGVIDRSPDRVTEAKRSFHIPLGAVTASARSVGWLDQIDAVSVATTPASHHPVVMEYLEAGKHVLVEKPMAMTVSEGREMRDLASRRGLVLGVVHNFQFSRAATRARRLLAQGRLGELRHLSGIQLSNPRRRLPTWYEELPLGLFYDESPHFFYLARSLLGPTVRVGDVRVVPSAAGRRTPASLSLNVEGGPATCRIDMNFEAPISEWQLVILGSQRLAAIDIFRDILIVLENDGRHDARQILRTTRLAVTRHLAGVARSGLLLASGRLAYGNDEVFARFAAACTTGRALVGIGPDDGLAVVEMQHQVIQAASTAR